MKTLIFILAISLTSCATIAPTTLSEKQESYRKAVKKQTRKPKDKDIRTIHVILFTGACVIFYAQGHWMENP